MREASVTPDFEFCHRTASQEDGPTVRACCFRSVQESRYRACCCWPSTVANAADSLLLYF